MKRYLFISLAVAGMFIGAGLTFRSAAHDHPEERNAFTAGGPAPPVVRLVSPLASAQMPPASTPLGSEMTISVHDYASVPAKLLSAAEEQAREIYRRAGLETVWLNCSPILEKIEPKSCYFSDATHLTLKIIPHALNAQVRDRLDVLGTAYPDDEGVGYFAYVFYDRVQELVKRQSLGCALLADVMAHEIGHLMLGSNSHSVSGIMCAHWNYEELRNIAEGVMWFIPAQSRRMRDRLRDRRSINSLYEKAVGQYE
jgi:hypothetical protein